MTIARFLFAWIALDVVLLGFWAAYRSFIKDMYGDDVD